MSLAVIIVLAVAAIAFYGWLVTRAIADRRALRRPDPERPRAFRPTR